MYLDNSWYGSRYIFSKYCNVRDKTVFASIQHGHVIFDEKNLGKKKIESTPWLVWNKKISDTCLKKGFKNIIPIGSVFIYLEKIFFFKKKIPKGTLVFPLLSQPELKNTIDYLDIFKDLKKKYPSPYTISVSIRDYRYLKKKYQNYKKINFVTWGSRGNKNYLKKLYENIISHKNIFCIYPGSALIYALYLNRKVFLSKKLYLLSNDKKYLKEVKKNIKKNKKDFQSYGLNFNNLNQKKSKKISEDILGVNFIKKPNDLKKLLGWNSFLKTNLAEFFRLIINLKENLINGKNYSQNRRLGKDFK